MYLIVASYMYIIIMYVQQDEIPVSDYNEAIASKEGYYK